MRRGSPIYESRCAGCFPAGLWAIVSGVGGGFYPDRQPPVRVCRDPLLNGRSVAPNHIPSSFFFLVQWHGRRRNNEPSENGKSADEQTPFLSLACSYLLPSMTPRKVQLPCVKFSLRQGGGRDAALCVIRPGQMAVTQTVLSSRKSLKCSPDSRVPKNLLH